MKVGPNPYPHGERAWSIALASRDERGRRLRNRSAFAMTVATHDVRHEGSLRRAARPRTEELSYSRFRGGTVGPGKNPRLVWRPGIYPPGMPGPGA
jgi:hypothetical protein